MSAAPQVELIDVNKRFGPTVTADNFSLVIHKGEFFTFLGPSGSGKSTILRMVAGLEEPDSGRILFAGRDLVGIPPWKRNLGMMFQHYAIFPHMTVAENVAYGLKARSMPSGVRRSRVQEMLELIGMNGKGDKNATLLSGGEQQRVALARALAPSPEMLLLDEPLSALDEKIRREMQLELKHIQRQTGTTFFYVTHDQEEALTMSDRIAVLNSGRCVQCDVPEIIFTRPKTRFVARFFRGCNVVDAELDDTGPGATVRFGDVRIPFVGRRPGRRPHHWALPSAVKTCVWASRRRACPCNFRQRSKRSSTRVRPWITAFALPTGSVSWRLRRAANRTCRGRLFEPVWIRRAWCSSMTDIRPGPAAVVDYGSDRFSRLQAFRKGWVRFVLMERCYTAPHLCTGTGE